MIQYSLLVSYRPRVRVHLHIIRNERIENVGKYQSCMVSKLPITWKQAVKLVLGDSEAHVRERVRVQTPNNTHSF